MSSVRIAAVLACLGLAFPACAAAATYTVTIANMAFGPAPSNLRVGDTIEWINSDIFEHTATAKDGAFDVKLPPKAHVRSILKGPGKVAFYCRYHPGMTGTLIVSR